MGRDCIRIGVGVIDVVRLWKKSKDRVPEVSLHCSE